MLALTWICLVSAVLAASRLSPPAGALVVAKSGGKYTRIQDAINALSTTDHTAQTIFIQPGTYDEQVYIQARSAALTIYGSTNNTSSYQNNMVTITHGFSQATVTGGNDKTATVRAWSSNFKMYNINMVNIYGKGSQALALSAEASNQGYYGCQFRGYQDTILTNTGTQAFAKSLIVGATDFIFGQQASTWFDQCDIRVLSATLGYITANGRSSATNPSYFVVHNSTVAAAPNNAVPNGAFYLGRPWKNYARVAFQHTSLSPVINTAGWKIWDTGDENINHVMFGEYNNSGTGAVGKRATFSTKLTAPVRIATILGAAWSNASYIDRGYLSTTV
ncbi:putative pectin methylesterase [Lophiotrema nucula]|uniref:Pectinesterase n=1 Tax=Lophiotrema nucula TaxID=690887 RepID=A0A6A5YHU4_9PLEO|nr:putative pectin methylesterase [Lophiotrema nucula]